MEIYRSRYEAYPYLSDDPDDLRCDYELLTDELASLTGMLRSEVKQEVLRRELLWIAELLYHMNPALRTHTGVTRQDLEQLEAAFRQLEKQAAFSGFVLPVGNRPAATAHVLRTKAKSLVRLLYRHMYQGHTVDPLLIDLSNLLSGYYHLLAMRLNSLGGVAETPFASRVYFSEKAD